MKWFGEIAFASELEIEPGVTENQLVTRRYFGDVLKNYKRDINNQITNNFTVNNQISVVADPFVMGNFHHIVYATFMGTKWRVSSVDVQYPRLILDLGDVYKVED